MSKMSEEKIQSKYCNDLTKLFEEITDDKILTFKVVNNLKSLQLLKDHKRSNERFSKYLFLIPIFALLLLSFEQPFYILKRTLTDSNDCILKVPGKMDNLFIPRFDCSICRTMKSIEKISGITPDEFENKYAFTGIPVVVENAMTNWTTNLFDFSFLKNLYLNVSESEEFENNCQFFPYKTEFKSLREVFEMDEERAAMKDNSNPWYVGWSNCNPLLANILRKHYTKPYFLPSNSESSRIDWILMGVPGYGAHLHIDRVGNPSWQAQIKGTKVWTIQAPFECYLQCNTFQITIEPGDILVIDTDKWYHKTLIVGNELSITIGSEFD